MCIIKILKLFLKYVMNGGIFILIVVWKEIANIYLIINKLKV